VIFRFGSSCSPIAVDPVFLEYDDTSVLYRTAIRPIVTYASETWVLKETTIQKLLVFERKILRRIFGPTKENQIWRIKTSKELDEPIKQRCSQLYQRLSWFDHIQRMPDIKTVMIFKWNPLIKRSQGRPKVPMGG